MTGQIRYTKLTANEILPDVIDRLHALRSAASEAAERQEDAVDKAPTNGGARDPEGWANASNEVARQTKWFSDAGIQIKSLEEGLVDFPAVIDGRQVLLCWKEGETEVAFWHTPQDGYPGRRPL